MIIVGLLQCGGSEMTEGRKQAQKWLDVNYNAYKGTHAIIIWTIQYGTINGYKISEPIFRIRSNV